MSNMHYCRCENTCGDLEDVLEGFYNGDISDTRYEKDAALRIREICIEIADQYGDMDDESFLQSVCGSDDDEEDDEY